MKLFLSLIAFLLTNVAEATASASSCAKKNTALHIELVTEKLKMSLHESIILSVTITNSSSQPVQLIPFMELESYWLRFEVVDEKNKRVRWLGPEVKMIENASRVTLYQGYYWGRRFEHFEQLYDLSKPGKYRIRAIYGVSPDGICPIGKVISNSLGLTIN
nr:hypothetical protein [uncultured Duganella sp.]